MSDTELKKLIADLAKEHKKTEIAQQKTEVAQQKTQVALAELADEHKKTEVAQQKTQAALIDLKQTIKETNKQLGNIGNTQGEIAEDLYRRNFKPLIEEWGIKLTNIGYRLRGFSEREYDLVGVNGKVVVLAEVKSKVSNRDIENLIHRQIPAFRDDFPKYKQHKVIGCVAGLIVRKEVEKKAAASGLFVLTQKGKDGAQVANTAGFKARLY